MKRPSSTCASTVTRTVTGNQPAQLRPDSPTLMLTPQTQSSKSAYDQYVSMCDYDSMLFGQVQLYLSQIAYFDKIPNTK